MSDIAASNSACTLLQQSQQQAQLTLSDCSSVLMVCRGLEAAGS
jgi:hypothetical protein